MMDAQSSNELQWLDFETVHQDSSLSSSHQGNLSHFMQSCLKTNYGISNKTVLEIPQFTTKPLIWWSLTSPTRPIQ